MSRNQESFLILAFLIEINEICIQNVTIMHQTLTFLVNACKSLVNKANFFVQIEYIANHSLLYNDDDLVQTQI